MTTLQIFLCLSVFLNIGLIGWIFYLDGRNHQLRGYSKRLEREAMVRNV